MATIHAIFENGVFKPVAPVELPDRCEVEFEPRVVTPDHQEAAGNDLANDLVFGVLDQRYDSGHHDTAERHNEHSQ